MHWGKAIIAIREAVGLKQVELSRRVGISKTALCQIEKAKARPAQDTIDRIAGVFGIEPVWIAMLAIAQGKMSEAASRQFRALFGDVTGKVLQLIKDQLNVSPSHRWRQGATKGMGL